MDETTNTPTMQPPDALASAMARIMRAMPAGAVAPTAAVMDALPKPGGCGCKQRNEYLQEQAKMIAEAKATTDRQRLAREQATTE